MFTRLLLFHGSPADSMNAPTQYNNTIPLLYPEYHSIIVLASDINIAGNQEILTNCCRSTDELILSRKHTNLILSRDKNNNVVSNKSYCTFA